MVRVVTKVGDVFSVKLDNEVKKYLQLIAFDLTQLNSDVIRAFKKVYPIHATPTLLDIINDDVDFYAHCVTKFGIRMHLSTILFRDTDDYGVMVGEEPIKISHNWFVWHINDDKFTYVGNLEGENRKAEIGVVMPPLAIVERIKTGKYSFVYPEFE